MAEQEYIFDYEIITEPENVESAIEKIQESTLFGLDSETTGLDVHKNEMVGISIANQDTALYFCREALPPFIERFKEIAKNKKNTFILHNAVFDLEFFQKRDIYVESIVDTMIASFMIDENRPQALKPLCEHYLGIDIHLPSFQDMQRLVFDIAKQEYKELFKDYRKKNPAKGTPLFGMEDDPPVLRYASYKDITALDMPLQSFGRYAALDARLAYDLWAKLLPYLERDNLVDIFFGMEMHYLKIIAEMELQGLGIDRQLLHELKDKYTQTMEEEKKIAMDIVGKEINFESSDELAAYLYEERGFPVTMHTEKTKKPSTEALALQRIVPLDSTGMVQHLLNYKKLQKVLSTYILPFSERIADNSEIVPRIYGSYKQVGTVTGRLSSNDPNLQNIPSKGELGSEIRELFIPRIGYVMLGADYSQLELRILAHYANDTEFINAFINNEDPHQITATLLNVPRHIGKTINFAWAYGAGPRKLCDTIEKTGVPRPKEADAREWITLFDEKRVPLTKWRSAVIKYARKLGYIKTIVGRRRHLPDLKTYDNNLRSRAERQSVNSIIQGSASDVIKTASNMIDIELREAGIDFFWVGQVHDEILMEVVEEDAEKAMVIVHENMIKAGVLLGIKAPLEASPATGYTWKQCH